MQTIHLSEVLISPTRQRKVFDDDSITALAGSILASSLLHAPVVEADGRTLVAGERRIRAVSELADFGFPISYGGEPVPLGYIPIISVGDFSPVQLLEAQLAENEIRESLTWDERIRAIAEIHELRQTQAQERGETQTLSDTAKELYPEATGGGAVSLISEAVNVSRFLEDEDVAKAGSLKEALKVIRQKTERAHHEKLAQEYNLSDLSSVHQLIKGSLFDELPKIPAGTVDLIIFDPPYGVYADEWKNQSAVQHHYEDTPELSDQIISFIATESLRLCRPEAHLYCFIDVRRFEEVCRPFRRAGWRVFHTPLIWDRGSNVGILPWPGYGPRRTYEGIIYAVRGDKPLLGTFPDVLRHPHDHTVERAAHKPPAVYADLMTRSCAPGGTVLDPCCGAGPIFPAAHEAKLKAIGIEIDEWGVGIAAERLKEITQGPF